MAQHIVGPQQCISILRVMSPVRRALCILLGRGKRAESKALLILCHGTFLHFPKIYKCTLSIMSKITIKFRKMCFIVMDELYKIIK